MGSTMKMEAVKRIKRLNRRTGSQTSFRGVELISILSSSSSSSVVVAGSSKSRMSRIYSKRFRNNCQKSRSFSVYDVTFLWIIHLVVVPLKWYHYRPHLSKHRLGIVFHNILDLILNMIWRETRSYLVE